MNQLLVARRKWIGRMAITLTFLCVPEISQAALVGHWTLEDNTTGLQNQGTAGGTQNTLVVAPASGFTLPTFVPSGGPAQLGGGGYASFNGTTHGLYIPNTKPHNQDPGLTDPNNNVVENINNYPFSFAAWFRPTGHIADPTAVPPVVASERATLMAIAHSASNNHSFRVQMGYPDTTNAGDFEANRSAGSGGSGFSQFDAEDSYELLTDGEWHHMAVVYKDATSIDIYLDGSIYATSTALGSRTYNPENNYLGIGAYSRNGTSTVDRWIGDIADARLYNHALDANEVAAIVPEPNSMLLVILGLSTIGLRIARKPRCHDESDG